MADELTIKKHTLPIGFEAGKAMAEGVPTEQIARAYADRRLAFLKAQERFQAANSLLSEDEVFHLLAAVFALHLKANELGKTIIPLKAEMIEPTILDGFLKWTPGEWLRQFVQNYYCLLPADSVPLPAISAPTATPAPPAKRLKDLTIDCRTDTPLSKSLYAFEGETTHEMFYADLGLNEKELEFFLQLLTTRPELRKIPSNKEDKAERERKIRYLETINGVLASYLDIEGDCFTVKHSAKVISCNIGTVIPAFVTENLPKDTNVQDDGKCDLEAKHKFAEKEYNDEMAIRDLMGG
jgi:hypothetical protein